MCSRVIIQKSVFRILHGYSIFLAMSFRDCNAQYSGILNYWSSWFMLSIIRVFFIFGILEKECVCSISNSTIDSLSRTASCHAGLYIILWISMDFQRFYIMDFSTMDFYGFISFASQSERADVSSVLLWHRQRIYMAVVQRCLSLGFIVQPISGYSPQLLISWLV